MIAVPVILLVLVYFYAIRWGAAEWERRGEAGPAFVAAAGACAVIAVVQSVGLGLIVAREQPELGASHIVLGLLFMVCLPALGALGVTLAVRRFACAGRGRSCSIGRLGARGARRSCRLVLSRLRWRSWSWPRPHPCGDRHGLRRCWGVD